MRVSESAIKRYANGILVVEINLFDSRCIGESIKRFMQLRFELVEGGYDIADYVLVQQAARSPYKKPLLSMKLHSRRENHRSMLIL
jgi:hypothetical protein